MDGSRILSVAEAEVGTVESPKNSNLTKYGKWFGLDGVAWCGIFVSWCYAMAGLPLGKLGYLKGFAGCQSAVAYLKKTGELTENPVPGDIVFFDWNEDKRYEHTGIFGGWIDKDWFWTVEGNTAKGNDSNGGKVMKRKRHKKFAIFAHPNVLKK